MDFQHAKSCRLAREKLRDKLCGTASHISGGELKGSVIESRRNAFSTIQNLIKRTIVKGEGNSVLVVGPRGSGKSWLIEEVLRSLDGDKDCRQNFITVKLNGLVHVDDKLALQEVARQLDINEDIKEWMSLSFASALNFLLAALQSGNHANKSILFLLDEFDLFTHHKNQTLLYNLFDTAQSAKNPIAVIGLTCRQDILELLEKRVKSRFSHRQINLFHDFTFDVYLSVFEELLTLPPEFEDREYSRLWQHHIKELVKNKSVHAMLKELYSSSPDIRSLKAFLTVPICRLGLQKPFLTVDSFLQSKALLGSDTVSAILGNVTILELCLIVAMKHVTDINGGEPFNFEMVYSEYKKFSQRSHSVEFFSRPVAMKAFEHLMSLELVHSVDRSSGKVLKEYQLMNLMLDEEQIKKAVLDYPGCPTDLTRWGTLTGIV